MNIGIEKIGLRPVKLANSLVVVVNVCDGELIDVATTEY